MGEIDPYDDIDYRLIADDHHEVRAIERAAKAMAKRVGLVFVPDANKTRNFVRATSK